MEDDPGFQSQRERLRSLLRQVEMLLGETDRTLDELASQAPNAANVGEMERLRVKLQQTAQSYLDQNAAFLDYVREHARKIEEANRKAAMAEKRQTPERNQARIQELSEELTRDLRLERVDRAIKELIDFLSDEEFFTANASAGRRRRLRALQNAIEKALQK